MPMGRPKTPLLLNPEENVQLRAVAASRSLPHGLVLRAKIILLSASGMSNQAIAARLDLNPVTVGYWRRRFLQQGLRGLHDELRPGRPRSISDEQVARRVAHPFSIFPLDGGSRLDDTTPVRQRRGTGLAFPGGRPLRF